MEKINRGRANRPMKARILDKLDELVDEANDRKAKDRAKEKEEPKNAEKVCTKCGDIFVSGTDDKNDLCINCKEDK